MINELTTALQDYQEKWNALVAQRTDKPFFESLKPTSVAWKTENLADYDARMAELRDLCDQIFVVWMNNRWIAKLHLKEGALPWNLRIIKLMQRRPGSTDKSGLDHVDFYTPLAVDEIEPLLQAEPNLEWNFEKNNAQWYSVWFAGGEAKIRDDTICGVCADELLETEKEILA
jgi:hypothetical protein